MILWFLFLSLSFGCEQVSLKSTYLSNTIFSSLSYDQLRVEGEGLSLTAGRSAYVGEHDGVTAYIYHTLASPDSDGVGRWVLSHTLGSKDQALAFVDSWAVMPNLVHAVNDQDRSVWKIGSEGEFIFDPSFQINCVSVEGREDNTIYLEVKDFAFSLSGFYVQISSSEFPVFSQVRSDLDIQYYLFKNENRWIIGENPGRTEGVAFVFDDAQFPGDIQNNLWQYSRNSEWHNIPTTIIQGDSDFNMYAKLRFHRFIPGVSGGQSMRRLRNELPIPAIGLGTAGLRIAQFQQLAEVALLSGYRLFDLAREYKNENLLAELLHQPHLPNRNEIFIVSKVWPTHLGFLETTGEILESLRSLQDPYVDLYMIHWPSCDPSVEWMHCQDTINPNGTLLQSYRSLERAYSEGRIGSIGLCSVSVEDLDALARYVTILPHAIQNFALPGQVDMDVRLWCFDHGALYFPLAYQRNAWQIPDEGKDLLTHFAHTHLANEHLILTRFFLQTGAIVTPGSTNITHIQDNLQSETFQLYEEEMNALGWPSSDPRHSEL